MNDKDIIKHFLMAEGKESNWSIVENPTYFENELKEELSPKHKFYGLTIHALANCKSSDDVLFRIADASYTIIHLTYAHEMTGEYPSFLIFSDLKSVLEYIKANS